MQVNVKALDLINRAYNKREENLTIPVEDMTYNELYAVLFDRFKENVQAAWIDIVTSGGKKVWKLSITWREPNER